MFRLGFCLARLLGIDIGTLTPPAAPQGGAIFANTNNATFANGNNATFAA